MDSQPRYMEMPAISCNLGFRDFFPSSCSVIFPSSCNWELEWTLKLTFVLPIQHKATGSLKNPPSLAAFTVLPSPAVPLNC